MISGGGGGVFFCGVVVGCGVGCVLLWGLGVFVGLFFLWLGVLVWVVVFFFVVVLVFVCFCFVFFFVVFPPRPPPPPPPPAVLSLVLSSVCSFVLSLAASSRARGARHRLPRARRVGMR